jgi:hypothetical protein
MWAFGFVFKAVEKVEVEKTTTVREWKGVNGINKCAATFDQLGGTRPVSFPKIDEKRRKESPEEKT